MNQKTIIALVAVVALVVVAGAGVMLMGGNGGDGKVHVSDVTLTGDTEIEVGETATLTYTIKPSDATDKSVTWSSSNTAVATVDTTGKVTAVSAGKAVITVTTTDGDHKATLSITVTKTVHVTGVTITAEKTETEVGGTISLTATVTPSDATDKSVTWDSSNFFVATVDSNGNVSATGIGTAVIIVTTKDGGLTDTVEIVVKSSEIVIDTPTVTEQELEDAKKKAESNPSVTLAIPSDTGGMVILDSKAIQSLDSSVTLGIDTVDVSSQPEDVREIVGSRPLYDITLGDVTTFGDGTLTVVLPYTPEAGEDTSKIFVYYVVSGSDPVKIAATYKDGYVTFTTTHLSKYAIMSDVSYTVSFTVDGAEYDSFKVSAGGYSPMPASEPVKAGSKFCCWTGYSASTPVNEDVSYEAYFSANAPYDYASRFSYTGVFGSYTASEKVVGMPATAVSANGYVANPENTVTWYVGSDAESFYSRLVDYMGGIQSVMGAEPVELAVVGVDNVVAYKTDVNGAVSFSMLYFAALVGDTVVYAVECSETPDRYSGIMSTVGVNPSTDEIAGFINAVLSSVSRVSSFAVGYAPDYVEQFVGYYGTGAFGSYALGESSTAASAVAEGNGNITWNVTPSGAGVYADYVAAMESYPGAAVFNVSGYENVSIYTVSGVEGTTVYFVAYSDVAFVSNFSVSEGAVTGGAFLASPGSSDIVTLVNFAVRTLGGSVYVLGGDLVNDVLISVRSFIDNYGEPDEKASWTIREDSTSSDVYLLYTYYNRSGNERIVTYHITYEKDIEGAFADASDLISSYIGQTAIMGETKFSDYDGEIPGVLFKAVTYWGSSETGTSAARFAVVSGNILIDGSLAPYVDPEKASTSYPYMKFTGNQALAEPQLKTLISAFAAISDYGLMYNVEDYAAGAEWFVENYKEPYVVNGETKGRWSVSGSSTTEYATLYYDFVTSNGAARRATLNSYVSENADADYAAICTLIDQDIGKSNGMKNYAVLDFGFGDITYHAIGCSQSTSVGIKFVIKSGDVIIDGSTPGYDADTERPFYFYVRASTAGQTEAVRYLFDTLIEAFTEQASAKYILDMGVVANEFLSTYKDSKATLSLVESTGRSAVISYNYSSASGAKQVFFYITYEDDIDTAYSALAAKVAALDGTQFLKSTVYSTFDVEIEGVTYTAVWYTGASMGSLRFAMAVGNVLVDASFFEPAYAYPYMYLNVTKDYQKDLVISILKSFNDGFSNVFRPEADDKVTVSVDFDTSAGTVTGFGKYEAGTEVTLTATPNAKYEFTGWYSDDVLLSEESKYVFVVENDTAFEARFVFVPGPSVTGVTVSEESVEIAVGERVHLTATVLPDDAENKGVVWSTSDRNVATVNLSGRVTGVAAGTVTVTVVTIDGGFTATCTVTVTAPEVSVTGVAIDYAEAEVDVGEYVILSPVFTPEDATNKAVLWSSDNMSVATVNDNGSVFGIAAGTAVITVTTVDGGFTATCTVTVKDTSGPEQVLIEDALGRIYGNANGDTRIDADDLQIINDIIAGTRMAEDFPLADANNDGTVDSADVLIVQKYIAGENVTLKVINAVDKVVDVRYPVEGIFTSGGTNMRSVMCILGIEEKIVANATNEYIGEVLDHKLNDLRESGKIVKCTTGATTADFANLMFVDFTVAIVEYAGTNGYNSDAALSFFNDQGADVLQLEYDTTEDLVTSLAIIGILTGAEDRAETFIKYMDDIVDTIRSTLGDKFGTATVMDIVMSNSVSGRSADYYAATLLAGGNNLADFDEINRTFTAGQDTWLYEEQYNPEYLIHIKSMRYGDTPTKTEISGYVSNFNKTAAYMNDSYYFMNGTLPYPVRLAYMASVMYSEEFDSEWYLGLFQKYVDMFYDEENRWDVREYKVTWTTEELKKFLD